MSNPWEKELLTASERSTETVEGGEELTQLSEIGSSDDATSALIESGPAPTQSVAPATGLTAFGSGDAAVSSDTAVSADAAPRQQATGEEKMPKQGQPENASFARVKKGWEIFFQEQAQNVQRASQKESIQQFFCGAGEGFARLTGQQYRSTQESDPFEPIVLRHTQSSPLQYSASMVVKDQAERLPPPTAFDQMRRSSSTPSGFRQSSIGSAFGTVPHLPDHADGSAFSLPAQRSLFASSSDSGVRYSAFDPVMMPQSLHDEGERTAIEVTDLGKATEDSPNRMTRGARVAKILNMRRRRRRSGRENPARPPSSSASLNEGSVNVSISVDEQSGSTKASADKVTDSPKETIGIPRPSSRTSGRASIPPVPEVDDEDVPQDTDKDDAIQHSAPSPQYQQLDSDVDEEYEHMNMLKLEGIEAAIQSDSPTATPSPAYHQFIDEASGRLSRPSPVSSSIPGVRLHAAATSPPPSIVEHAEDESNARTPVSQDSAQSPGTNESSSGHTTIATSTSATLSSSHASALSSVSETDIEVMETNIAGKQRRRQQTNQGTQKQDESVHSASTTSTNTHGYLALAGSPASLREGANLQTERFFRQDRIPISHSASSNSGSTGTSSSGSKSRGETSVSAQSSPTKKESVNSGLPQTESGVAKTNPSRAAGDEPRLKLASYLDRKNSGHSGEGSSLPSVSEEGSGGGKSSPAKIVGYSDMVFEEAKMPVSEGPDTPKLFRPVQKRAVDRFSRVGSRPPRSPAKGLRTPTTPPPPQHARIGETSPVYQHLSPPRNIIDHSIREDLSKPYAVFGPGARSLGENQHQPVLVSPEEMRRAVPYDEVGENWAQEVVVGSEGRDVYTYRVEDEVPTEGVEPTSMEEVQSLYEPTVEVKNSSDGSGCSTNLISPDKGA